MSTEVPQNDVVSFMASIPPSASAIKFDGEANGGGSITLVVSGSDEEGLRRMLLLRGRRFLVSAVLIQTELPLTPAEPDGQEPLLPEGWGKVELRPTAASYFAEGLPEAHPPNPDEVREGAVLPKSRKVNRGLVPKVRRKKVGAAT